MNRVRKYPIYFNYRRDALQGPAGYVEIDDDQLSEVDLAKMAIVPEVAINYRNPEDGSTEEVCVRSFGMIPRTRVDTSPHEELGEK